MKVLVTSRGNNLDSEIDPRFGRCKYFLLIDVDNNEIKDFTAEENQGTIQGQGAGIRAAQQAGDHNPDIIITGALGPNASKIIDDLKIAAYKGSGRINEAIDKLNKGELVKLNEISEAHTRLQGKNTDSESETNTENQGERIYFPLLTEKGMESEISYHFGHAPFFGVYDVVTKELSIINNTLDHVDPNKSPIDQIIETVNPTTIFAQGIGSRAVNIIKEKGLRLKTGNFKTVQEVVNNLDKLEDHDSDCGHEH